MNGPLHQFRLIDGWIAYCSCGWVKTTDHVTHPNFVEAVTFLAEQWSGHLNPATFEDQGRVVG